ncbi:MAG: HIT domain-containing protein [Alphaproteobacteria bacterium]|uniref:HIT domain-containing protein n=1 Tax=Candidatus Nitrobium versatile TaxID=2884831 RepID=A0A953JF88_9BACT|nr:HIT domain-containing protein [Candidatus Nitrobium versatile]
MRTIWAPWRMEYILSDKEKECIFCVKPEEGRDRENLILHRGGRTFIIMNKYPYTNGHLMVVPYLHVSTLEDLPDEDIADMGRMTKYAVECLRKAFHPEGFNVGINIGEAAGAGIEEHLHLHIVPRWAGDSNFMTVVGEVRVVPEHILETYDKLFPVFNP